MLMHKRTTALFITWPEIVENIPNLQHEATLYKKKYKIVLQSFMQKCQHHIHQMDKKTGLRIIPNKCKTCAKPNQCRYDAPWTNRLNDEKPFLLCKGLAKRYKLRPSGARNALGTMLGLRNNEWLTSTMPDLCLTFGGSNSDVSPNDRLVPNATMHENEECNGRCAKPGTIRKIRRLTQRSQATTNG